MATVREVDVVHVHLRSKQNPGLQHWSIWATRSAQRHHDVEEFVTTEIQRRCRFR
jgi:hypothetical protein